MSEKVVEKRKLFEVQNLFKTSRSSPTFSCHEFQTLFALNEYGCFYLKKVKYWIWFDPLNSNMAQRQEMLCFMTTKTNHPHHTVVIKNMYVCLATYLQLQQGRAHILLWLIIDRRYFWANSQLLRLLEEFNKFKKASSICFDSRADCLK